MNNNKNRMKDRDKSNATMRKIDPSRYADKGIINGEKIGVHDGKNEKSNKILVFKMKRNRIKST